MAKVISGCVMAWGAILMITAATHDFGGMATCRFLLGTFESAITPLFLMMVGMWVGVKSPVKSVGHAGFDC